MDEEVRVQKEKGKSAAGRKARDAAVVMGVQAGHGIVRSVGAYAGEEGPDSEEYRALRNTGRVAGDVLGVVGARSAARFWAGETNAVGIASQIIMETAQTEGKKHVSPKEESYFQKNLTRRQAKILHAHFEDAAAMVSFRKDLQDLAKRNPKIFGEKGEAYLKDAASFLYLKDTRLTKHMASQILSLSDHPEIRRAMRLGLDLRETNRLLRRKDLSPMMRNALIVMRQALRKDAARRVLRAKRSDLFLHTVNLISTGAGSSEDASSGTAQLQGMWHYLESGARLTGSASHLGVTSARAALRLAVFAAQKSGAAKAVSSAAAAAGTHTAAAAGAGMAAAKNTKAGRAATTAAGAVKETAGDAADAVRDVKNAVTGQVKDVTEHVRSAARSSAVYQRAEEAGKEAKRRSERAKVFRERRRRRAQEKQSARASGIIAKIRKGMGAASGGFSTFKTFCLVSIAAIFLLWILLLVIVGLLGGSFGEMQITTVSTMDVTGDDLTQYLARLRAYDSEREENAITAAQEILATDAAVYTVTDGHTIDAWGHPENEDPDGNAQEAFDGINISYVDGSAFDEGSTDETGRPTEDHVMPTGYSNAEAVIAAAASMFSNTGIQENEEAFLDLLDDLWEVMNPSNYADYCFASGIYANAYWNEEEWRECAFVYYCDDEESRAEAESVLSEFREELFLLQEEGAGVYGYQYTVSRTDRGGNTEASESGVMVLSFSEKMNEREQLITTHDISGIAVPIESSAEGCCSYEVTTYELVVEEVQVEDVTQLTGYRTELEVYYEPVETTVYYCPGHSVSVSACVDYGRRDVDIYIPVWTIDDLFERFTVDEYLTEWESASYAEWIRAFVEDGGWQIGDGQEYYRTLCENILSRDWEEAYDVDVRGGSVLAGEYSSGSRTYSDGDIDSILSGTDYSSLSGSREELVRAAYAAVGTIAYYYGGKPVSPVYEENDFGSTVSPDPSGRTIRGLDCSGFIDYIAWQVTGSSNYMQGMGTAGAPGEEFYDASELLPGDLGMYKSRSDSAQGASNHVGIFVGWDEDGNALWIACGSKGVTLQKNSGFVVYYRCPLG